MRFSSWTGLAAALLLGWACALPGPPEDTEPQTVPGDPDAGVSDHRVADFQLVDANPQSPTHGQTHSPRQQLGRISAWYFGRAT